MLPYTLKIAVPSEIPSMVSLVNHVFMQFEAPNYPVEGVDTFLKYIEAQAWLARMQQGGLSWVCMDGSLLLGVLEMRKPDHISLLFVAPDWHHLGIATRLWEKALDHTLQAVLGVTKITVNSSPYALGFYQKIGFSAVSGAQQQNGIIYIPMEYQIA